ncbi:exo-rhamnogalacturonan lyase family protein [Paenibacillus puerhi]|uniref:exo-rhamnogalacturonan lyase family protein n=1 Tax=Paenibacillus puerhi TaxID=2692622 RepID=UPI001916C12A|nr:hypothetical protein [Paenibacillus puerhi]
MRATKTVKLKWLQEQPNGSLGAGVTWGVPWAEGTLKREEALTLRDSAGDPIPVQSWPTAFWPDGSVKWTAHAASLAAGDRSLGMELAGGEPVRSASPVTLQETDSWIEVDTGAIACRFSKAGTEPISRIVRSATGALVCSGARLTAIRETRSVESGSAVYRLEQQESVVLQTTVEQQGEVRTVVKVDGKHRPVGGGASWLPFTLRFYLYSGQASIKAVYTFHYDGDPERDFIKGLGLRFDVPLEGELYNRHVRLAGDTGFFAESPKGLETFRTRGAYAELYKEQTAGRTIRFDPQEDVHFVGLLEDSAVWDSFKLTQPAPDSYTIVKRTKEGCSWVRAAYGSRAGGLLYAGGASGGLAVGMRSFWQQCPAALEVAGMSADTASMTAWFWSPDAEAMDLRHYDTETHVLSAYEGFDELRSTPFGVGHTSELTVWCLDAAPTHAALAAMTEAKEQPPLLVCEPQCYYESGAAGVWSLPDRSTETKAWLEDGLDQVFDFYRDEVEQRRWYGFWDYGDVMHSYDPVRHTWRYDIGGCAWQNTELAPNLWLWYTFLRTGRADAFRMAEAMARHTSEVDVYRFGEYAGLGSRHNVVHWGCGCKEARIGMAGLHTLFYYLTADERIGEMMDEFKDSDYATERLDPMRSYYPKDEFPTHARSGPDWTAFASNWLTRWERHEDTFYRDKLMVGIDSLKRQKHGLLTGPVFGYDPRSGELQWMGHENWGHHLMICMGGTQVWLELARVLKDPKWEDMVAEYGEFYTLPNEEKARRTNGDIPGKDWNIPMLATPLMAYSSVKRSNPALAEEAWKLLLQDRTHWQIGIPLEAETVEELAYIRPITELPWISTNTASQWCLNVMMCLELIPDALPELKELEEH